MNKRLSCFAVFASLLLTAAGCDDSETDADADADTDMDRDTDGDSDGGDDADIDADLTDADEVDDADPTFDSDVEADAEARATIGDEGGAVDIPGVARVTIPEGVLGEPTEVVVRVFTPESPGDDETGLVWTTPVISLSPDGLYFSIPVTLTIHYDPDLLPAPEKELSQSVYRIDDGPPRRVGARRDPDPEELDLDELVWPTIDHEADTISVPLLHFSDYVGGADSTTGDYHYETLVHGHDALRVLRHAKAKTFTTDDGLVTRGGDRNKGDVRFIVLHHTDQDGVLMDQFADGHEAAREGEASAHFWVGRNGVIAQVADSLKIVGHASCARDCGEPRPNKNSVGIEILNDGTQEYPLVQLLAVRRLVGYLSRRFEIGLRGRRDEDLPMLSETRYVNGAYRLTDDAPTSGHDSFDKLLGHREVDQHKWLISLVLDDPPSKATKASFTASVPGYFKADSNWHCGDADGAFDDTWTWTTDPLDAGTAFERTLSAAHNRGTRICFQPSEVTDASESVTITATLIDNDGADACETCSNTVEYTFDTWNDQHGPDDDDTVAVHASPRRRDPSWKVGRTYNPFPWSELTSLLDYTFTGIIDTSGGDANAEYAPGDAGDVTVNCGHSFKGGYFDKAEQLYLDTMDAWEWGEPADEAVRSYNLIVADSAPLLKLAAGDHDYNWVIIEGRVQLEGDTKIRAAGGIYVGEEAVISTQPNSKTDRDAYSLTLESPGEVLIHGVIDARGRPAHLFTTPGPAGKGGSVEINMLAGEDVLIPTIIARGGDADEYEPSGAQGGKGGNVAITCTGRVVLGGGPDEDGDAPYFLDNLLPPPPPNRLAPVGEPWPGPGELLPLTLDPNFQKGIITSGGMGGHDGGDGRPGGPGGAGGDIYIKAAELAPTNVVIWTGAGLELIRREIELPSDGIFHEFRTTMGCTGGPGDMGGGSRGGNGGDGGAAGNITLSGAWVPTITRSSKRVVYGWNWVLPTASDHMHFLGHSYEYEGPVPDEDGATKTRLLEVSAVGGSGGLCGGSYQEPYSPGRMGRVGADGVVSGIPF